jgi:D-mannonate dehydratase
VIDGNFRDTIGTSRFDKTVVERDKKPLTWDTIEDDDIKEEINIVEDDSEDEVAQVRQRLIKKLSNLNKVGCSGQMSTSSALNIKITQDQIVKVRKENHNTSNLKIKKKPKLL